MKRIEFVIPAYGRPNNLLCVISSIVSQTVDRWKIHVVSDTYFDGLDKVMDIFKDDERIRFTTFEKRYNDWGHTPRNYGLKNCNEEWVVMTGDDNYYMPIFVHEFIKVAELYENAHFVYCNMVHNWIRNRYIPIESKPQLGKIDIGNFMAKTEYAKQMELDVKKIDADGYFVEEYLRRFSGEAIHVPKVLYVHN